MRIKFKNARVLTMDNNFEVLKFLLLMMIRLNILEKKTKMELLTVL